MIIVKRNHKQTNEIEELLGDVMKSIGEHAAEMLDKEQPKEDVVKHPSHYQIFPDMEVIDVIKSSLTPEEYIGYCKGNILKYKLRAGEKDDVQQDLRKAVMYQMFLGDMF